MKRVQALLFILLAGTCSGIFFYIDSLAVLQTYTTATDAKILWTFSSFATFSAYILIADLVLLTFWVVYSCVYANVSGECLKDSLETDACTYLPLCLLILSVAPFNTFFTHYFEGLLLFSPHSLGYLLLLTAALAVCYLKAQNLRKIRRVGRRTESSARWGQHPGWKIKLSIFLISLSLYTLAGLRITDQLQLGGDEPHYLLITHSLLHDHDIAISNNYRQQDYRTFYPNPLDSHVSIGKDLTRYPGHPIGLSFLLLPAYALKGRQGCVVFMNVLSALLALQLYLLAFSLTRRQRPALFLWFVSGFTSPLLIYSSQIYPEVPSALLVVTAYRVIISQDLKKLSQSLMLGGSLALLPWIQQRMIVVTVILSLHYFCSLGLKGFLQPFRSLIGKPFARQDSTPNTCQMRFIILPVLLLVISGFLMAGFYYTLYGTPMPNAPYKSVGIKSVFSLDIFLKEGMFGLFLDQEGGLLTYSPYYLFLFAGFMLLLRQQFSTAFWLLLMIASIYIPCGGFTLKWRGSWSPASRYMVALIPLFLPPLCISLQQARRKIYRYTFLFLVAISGYWSYLFLKDPFLSIMRGGGSNSAFLHYSGLIDLTHYFPSFTPHSTENILVTGLWLAIILMFSVCLYRAARNLESTFESTSSINKNVKQVFALYGVILVGLLIFTSLIDRSRSVSMIPQLNRNRQLHKFLDHADYHTLAMNELRQQQPIASETFRFEYISREKRGKVNQQGARFIVTGPREAFPKGRYTAYFKLLVDENSLDEEIATLEVVAERGQRVFARKPLRGAESASSGAYKLFPLAFELPEQVEDLETRVYFHNRVDMSARKIYITPDLSGFYYNAGLSLLWKGEYEEAKTVFLRALSVSDHVRTSYQIAVVEQMLKNWERSIEILQQVVERDPKFADAHYRLGVAFKEMGHLEKARQRFEQATSFLASHLDAWEALREIYRQSGIEKQGEDVQQTINKLYHPQYPYTVNIGNQIMFMGYDIRNPAPGILELEYYWKALAPMETDYSFFVHFKNYGTTFQQDHIPHIEDSLSGQMKIYPTSQWKIGELIHEKFEISAPAGTFRMKLGVWDALHTKQRLPLISSPQQFFFWKEKEIELKNMTIR